MNQSTNEEEDGKQKRLKQLNETVTHLPKMQENCEKIIIGEKNVRF